VSATARPSVVIPELLQGQWTTALICTFGANLMFFETRLMSQLAQVPLRIILADNGQLVNLLGEAARTGQRHRLANKAYVVAPIRHPRSAHGKLVLLLGPSSGRLIVGSGNLGYDGYASPGELWHVFAYTNDQPQHLSEFAAARSFVDGLASRGLIDPPVDELLQIAWGAATWLPAMPAQSATVSSNLDRSIIEELRETVPDRVIELITHAPFHDADCAALNELITTFAPDCVRLLVSDATSADPAAIERVLGGAARQTVELVQVEDEPAAYIHAKWVHLIHPDSQTLLTGSANLSRSALLRASSNGNIEIAVISTGPAGAFDSIYAHLRRKQVKDVTSLRISYQGNGDDDTADARSYPIALWSRLDGEVLGITFNEVLPAGTTLVLTDHAGLPLLYDAIFVDGAAVIVKLGKDSAERLSDGGRVSVRLGGNGEQLSFTWPYQVGHLRGRLEKAGQRDRLPRIGDLPDQDKELYELLHELDQTLIIDRESVWRIAKPGAVREPGDGEQESAGLENLDWERVRRDPRYGGYFTRGRAPGLPPTDIQVVLAAIAGRLGDLGLDTSRSDSEEREDLAHEGDTGLSAESEDADEELEDELTRRRLPIGTRTRMAFDRFVRRYAAALGDSAFINELGPIPAATNAVVFDHLLARLLEREGVSPRWAINAQLETWRFLWGDSDLSGAAEDLDDETADAVRSVFSDAGARLTTVRSLVASLDYVFDDETLAALRDTARHLLTDDEFGLDAALLMSAAGGGAMAPAFLSALSQVAEPTTSGEIMEYVVAPYGIPQTSAEWRKEQIRRVPRGRYQSITFVVGAPVERLTVERAREVLERVAAAAYYAGNDTDYFRVRFEGNGKAVAYWDRDSESGVVMVDDEIEDVESFNPAWPDWSARVDELAAELADFAPAT
jgi:hypothetical protein